MKPEDARVAIFFWRTALVAVVTESYFGPHCIVKESLGNMYAPLTLPGYREEFVRLLYAIIVVEFVVIAILLFGFSNEYLSNAYLRDWIGANQPFLGILLHGEVDSLFIGVALGALLVLVQRRVRAAKSQEDLRPSINPSVPDYTSTSPSK
jgi:hypothetical protein